MAAVDLVAPSTKILGSKGFTDPVAQSVGPGANKAWVVEAIWAKANVTSGSPTINVTRKRTSATAYETKIGHVALALGAPAVDLLGVKNGLLDNFYGDTYEIDSSGGVDVTVEYVEYS